MQLRRHTLINRHVIALLGATASGKTAVAIAIGNRLPIEVVSADSRQIRRHMSIGSAAPSDSEQAALPHHLIEIVEPDAPWTLSDFLTCAHSALEEIWERNHLPLVVGGSGQYIWALLEGWRPPSVPPNFELRSQLEMEASEHGSDLLHQRLRERDPSSADRIDPRNTRRVIRALEIIEATGAPIAALPRITPPWPWRAIGLSWPREKLYEAADKRTEQMYANGLIEETRKLITRYGDDFDALRSIGHAEAARVITGEWDEETAIRHTKTSTHRLIRHQNTWFSHSDKRIHWCNGTNHNAVIAAVEDATQALVR